jgi:TusA-related sulfurtransferase
MRRAILSANDGDFLIIKGDHEKSFSEIQMGAESMSCEIIEKTIDKNGVWIIKILVKK